MEMEEVGNKKRWSNIWWQFLVEVECCIKTHPEFTSMAVIGNPAIFYINHKRKKQGK